MQRIAIRTLPSGKVCHVHPFHICLKGTESSVLCRDDEDYDRLVKVIAVAALRKDVIVVIYTVVSNHCHVVVLASSQPDAFAFGEEIKRVYSMWFSRKYDERGALRRIQSSAIWLDTDWYLRNALAYVPRNALDNGCNVDEYKWSGYQAMFRSEAILSGCRVSDLTRREKEKNLHTGTDLGSVKWMLDQDGCLIPGSFCDSKYLEQAFDNSQAFFLKTIGSLNPAEMNQKLVESHRTRVTDGELFKAVEEISRRWFDAGLTEISFERKLRLLSYVFQTRKTSSHQLARVLGLTRDQVDSVLRQLKAR